MDANERDSTHRLVVALIRTDNPRRGGLAGQRSLGR